VRVALPTARSLHWMAYKQFGTLPFNPALSEKVCLQMFEKLIFFVLHLNGRFRTLKNFKISGTKPRGSSAGNLARVSNWTGGGRRW
jgi:hypothetical protein